ncbi:SRPBCC family protein [Piscinibacter terrae]|uniref:SRPBCC domain-containing protein n=1 Tax=Piscinibacter terrae TaxID=2496871 RepID=A0A3N7J666_9BURK|nr:SRPBCC domain-containing protein [Albitalea terrae]RQP26302.1 SRPBCC domain-containing protein [Albitalea terrae]
MSRPDRFSAPGASLLDDNTPEPERHLPFLTRYPIIAGAVFGVLLRLMFSGQHQFEAMAAGFIYFAPVAVGAVTVYLAERIKRRSWLYYLGAPFLATSLFVAGTLLIMIEGIICAIVIVPMFAVMGAIGGLVMGIVCRVTDWPKPAVYCLSVIPLVLGLVGDLIPTPDDRGTVERTLHIAAPPEAIWKHLNAATDIRADEVGDAWAFRIGAPMPLSGLTRETPQGHVRSTTWGRKVHFDEVVATGDWEPGRRIRWTYRFAPDSFPPGSLDDHVMIGGRYFDLLDTTYTLTPQGNGTLLHYRVSYRISTQFNPYADWVARTLLGDFGDVMLKFYKSRSEVPSKAA